MNAVIKPIPKSGAEWPQGFQFADVPTPKVEQPDDVILKVVASGVCGTDVSIYRSQQALAELMRTVNAPRVVIGHEFCGRFHAWGARALEHIAKLALQRPFDNQRVRQFLSNTTAEQLVADPAFADLLREEFYVTAEMHVTCGQCLQCSIGQKHLCQNTKVQGIHMDGSYAGYVRVPARDLIIFTKGEIDPDIIAFMDAIGNGVHMVQATDVVGRSLLITGCGVQGLVAVALGKMLGANPIICTDAVEAKLALAKKLGADVCANMGEPDASAKLKQKISELTGGNGVDAVFEMSGSYRAYPDVLANVRQGGFVTLLGLPSGTFPVDFSPQVIFRGLTIHGVFGRRIFDSWHMMQELLAQGLGKTLLDNGIITHRLPLERYDEGFKALQEGKAIKVLLYPHELGKQGVGSME